MFDDKETFNIYHEHLLNKNVTKVCLECGAVFHPFKEWETTSNFCCFNGDGIRLRLMAHTH